MVRACRVLVLLIAAVAASTCGPGVDLGDALELTEVTTGWYDAGIVAGRNKLVPSVTFRIRKRSPADIDRLALNALFRARDGQESSLDNDVYVQRVQFEGETTQPITVRTDAGYTADPPQSRADMLQNSQFRDLRVQILVKRGSSQWVDLGTIEIERQLITQ
jgi:hypothetical protein